MLFLKYQQELGRPYNNIQSQLDNTISDPQLWNALKICLENSRTESSKPVDLALVYSDVNEIVKTLTSASPDPNTLFNILLRRSDCHIRQIAIVYELKTHMKLDEAIRKSVTLDKMTIQIGVHAVRTAINMAYRDAMLLRNSLCGDDSFGSMKSCRLGIRVCRMHWYKQQWLQIKAEFQRCRTQQLVHQLSSESNGMLRDFLVRMAKV